MMSRAAVLAVLATPACLVPASRAQDTIPIGRLVPTEGLAAFKPGISTKSDVRAALGEPRGEGFIRHNPKEALRQIWFYEYIQMRAKVFGDSEVGLKIVLVFFKGDRYDGHLWFSAKELVDVKVTP
jgi:hypothetical protein